MSQSAERKFTALLKREVINFLLIALGSLLFVLSFPNDIVRQGIGFLSLFALVPVFLVIRRTNWIFIFIFGGLYGFFSYYLMNWWLGGFHALAIYIVPLIYFVYYLLLFPLLKLIDRIFPSFGFLFQAFVWVVFEYLRTQGFLGYSYGVLGYALYSIRPLIQTASLGGVWMVTFIAVFFSRIVAFCLEKGRKNWKSFLQEKRRILAISGLFFLVVLIFGFLSPVDTSSSPLYRVALIQQNNDPLKIGYRSYGITLDILIKQSLRALKENPQMVVWSETSFVPAIDYHLRYKENNSAYLLVKKLMDFMKTQKVPYVLGNDDGRKINIGTEEERRVDYNAAIHFENGEIQGVYRKIHLVPFTEHFPYKKSLPWLYKMLEEADTHFWEPGNEFKVFKSGEIRFSTPICFEDTFGYLCRRFVKEGAELLVNMTNDSWASSETAETQHMIMAVFRGVENRRTVLRSTNSGITCTIDPNGKILNRLERGIEGFLISDVPYYTGPSTLYTLWGDWFPFFCLALIGLGLVFKIIRREK